jgi:AraC-like DNA-binding protein
MSQNLNILKNKSTVSPLDKTISPSISSALFSNITTTKALTLMDYAPVCTKILDLDFNLQYMSPTGIKALKIDDVTALYGQPYPFDFYPKSFREQTKINLTKAVQTNEVIEQEASVVDTQGNELWFHSTIIPIKGENGKIETLAVISIDTTEHQNVEHELSEYKNILDNLNCSQCLDISCDNRPSSPFIKKAFECVTTNVSDSDFDVNALAEQLFMSRSTLQRKLAKDAGVTASEFIRQIRLYTAHEFIQRGAHRTIAETSQAVGFKQAGYFSKLYKEYVSELNKTS